MGLRRTWLQSGSGFRRGAHSGRLRSRQRAAPALDVALDVALGCQPPGMHSTVPANTRLGFQMPLACIRAWTDVPKRTGDVAQVVTVAHGVVRATIAAAIPFYWLRDC